MTGAFDRRVQELADSVTQGLQPSVQFVTPEFYVVKSAESIDNTTATFTGTSAVTPLASDTYVAVYPYRSVSTDAWQIGRTHIRMTLPEQQSHPFQFKDLGMMIAKTPDSGSEQVRLSFKNIFPILKFSLTGSRTLAAIRFRGNDGEPVAGDFRLDISGDAYMEADFSESTVEEVSLTCGVRLSATPQTFYLVVPPRTYAKGYTIDFVADDGSVMTQVVSKDTPKTLLRSKIYEYPTLAFTPQSTAEAACDWLWQDETGVVSNVGFDELPGAVDLGAAANCFIVSVPGNYKFKAVKGDGSAVDGVDGRRRQGQRRDSRPRQPAGRMELAYLAYRRAGREGSRRRLHDPRPQPRRHLRHSGRRLLLRSLLPMGTQRPVRRGERHRQRRPDRRRQRNRGLRNSNGRLREEYDRPDGLRIRRNRQRRQHHYRLRRIRRATSDNFYQICSFRR